MGAIVLAQRLARAAKISLGCLGLFVLPWLVLWICSWCTPLPEALRDSPAKSIEVYDRNGRLLRVVRTRDGKLAANVGLSELSPYVVPALIAAEDARFYSHPGIDPFAIARAAAQAVRHGRLVSGASTLTQQLARTLESRPRTLAGKLREMVLALRIERSLDKPRILEEYLSRVEFGPNVRGIEAASRYYFDKPVKELSLAEAATLVGIPRGPTLYDPRRGTERVARRRDRILERMQDQGLANDDAIQRARETSVVVRRRAVGGGIEHLTQALIAGSLSREVASSNGVVRGRLDTTIDQALQHEVEALAHRAAADLVQHDASALAVLVVDNASSEVLAYLGSPDFSSEPGFGQNDGTQALRQPGSTLKPFVYAAAMRELGFDAATLLPDLEVYLQAGQGDVYAPKNYDRKSHGPVRLREALGSSLNLPAVWSAEKVGVERVLSLLRDFGFTSLDQGAEHYGPALALGDGEVKLSELVAAYATLGRGGVFKPLSYLISRDSGRARPAEERRVLESKFAAVLTDILADERARASGFGLDGVLSLPFPVAVKTGTSKGLRDNWTIGFTQAVTVGVWVGNFDGRPLVRSSGVTGAGPLFREVMLAAMRGRIQQPLVDESGLESVEVCALSGMLAGPDCPHRLREVFASGKAPAQTCSMHERVRIDPQNGLLAGARCPFAEEKVFESYPVEYASWARAATRPIAPLEASPRCPLDRVVGLDLESVAGIVFPSQGARFVIDDLARERQEILLEVRAPLLSSGAVEFVMDRKSLGPVAPPYQLPWRLAPGAHHFEVLVRHQSVASRDFEVTPSP